jgi:hypothetical protein
MSVEVQCDVRIPITRVSGRKQERSMISVVKEVTQRARSPFGDSIPTANWFHPSVHLNRL